MLKLSSLLLLVSVSCASAQEHYLALAYSSRQVYIVSNGGTRAQCERFISARKDRASVHYACAKYEDVRNMIRTIFGPAATETM